MVIVELNTMNKYAIEILYSDEDEGYITVVPELSDCSAFGETEEWHCEPAENRKIYLA
jgi:hypothetical protein